MELIPCHCNGSRGTDCDWCGGSGYKKYNPPKVQNLQRKFTGKPSPEILKAAKKITSKNFKRK